MSKSNILKREQEKEIGSHIQITIYTEYLKRITML
jgi:hypothetical protein